MQALSQALRQFTGTVDYHKLSLSPLLCTDGTRYFAEKAKAFWLIDLVALEIWPCLRTAPFLTITLEVFEGSVAVVTAGDGNGATLHQRNIPYTDCERGTYRFFLVGGVLMLPSEY